MVACTRTFALIGLDARAVCVEVDVRSGLPAFSVIGLGDASVRESRERVQAAIRNSGFEFPARRVTANLAPAHLRKGGPGFDLALACAVLAASGQVPGDLLARVALYGELSLLGTLRGGHGALAIAHAAQRAGLGGVILARRLAREASLAGGLTIAGVDDLRGAVAVLRGGRAPVMLHANGGGRSGGAPAPAFARLDPDGPDLGDVRGQRAAVRAAIVSAAGGHNLLLSGPPGVGKTMLATRVASILPTLTPEQSQEVTRIRSLASFRPTTRLVTSCPFRAPHHTITAAGLVGGANPHQPGEVVLAHHGVLFLDELTEFSRAALEALRQPLEDGIVAITRAAHTAVHPARFMLIAATNPCPCGLGADDPRCGCADADIARHARRLSRALLDRLDVIVQMARPSAAALRESRGATSAAARMLVAGARARQAARAGCPGALNARMGPALLGRHARLDPRGDALLARAHASGALSARAHQRVLAVARTVADLEGRERVRCEHVAEALALHGSRPIVVTRRGALSRRGPPITDTAAGQR